MRTHYKILTEPTGLTKENIKKAKSLWIKYKKKQKHKITYFYKYVDLVFVNTLTGFRCDYYINTHTHTPYCCHSETIG
jgi:hypothetical protein